MTLSSVKRLCQHTCFVRYKQAAVRPGKRWRLKSVSRAESPRKEARNLCPEHWILFAGKCYFFSTSKDNFGNARTAYQSSQSNVVVINNSMEQDFLVNRADSQFYWIGLIDMINKGVWLGKMVQVFQALQTSGDQVSQIIIRIPKIAFILPLKVCGMTIIALPSINIFVKKWPSDDVL